jgi:hypothetical protein
MLMEASQRSEDDPLAHHHRSDPDPVRLPRPGRPHHLADSQHLTLRAKRGAATGLAATEFEPHIDTLVHSWSVKD